ncbi:MAG: glycosyltransferase [Cyclobacteriaceae bacterium]|nr:glycosyltransferase [Cyclobacteriaceae bacterium]
MIIAWIFGTIVFIYCLFVLYLWLGWEQIELGEDEEYLPSVAVIIPVRNEAETIRPLLQDLFGQTYKGMWEMVVVNDHSEDHTIQVVKNEFKGKANCHLLELEGDEGKKAALAMGIANTQASIILTIDGDCRVRPEWIKAMTSAFSNSTQMVSGPVGFTNNAGLFHQMQVIEFASLIGSGAALIGWHKPVMANGANLAFRKSAFEAVGGYNDSTTASGDDVFLLHKIAEKYPDSVAFARNEEAIVRTQTPGSFKRFWQQRKRWASKWKAYSDGLTRAIAVFIFIVSLSMGALPVLVASGVVSLFTWLNLLVAKSFFDYFFLRQIVKFSGAKMNLPAFLLLQLIYPYYVVSTALFSFRKTYSWKGRKVK